MEQPRLPSTKGLHRPLQMARSRWLRQTLRGLVDGVAAVQIREDKHVGVSRDLRSGELLLADFRNDGGIELHFTVDEHIRRKGFRLGGRLHDPFQ